MAPLLFEGHTLQFSGQTCPAGGFGVTGVARDLPARPAGLMSYDAELICKRVLR